MSKKNKALQERYKSTSTRSAHRGVTQPKVSTKKIVAPQNLEKLITMRQKHRKALHSHMPAGCAP